MFGDFLELAMCAIRKQTVAPGPEADAIGAQYMQVVARHHPGDIRAMPELLALVQLAVGDGGCDFLGDIASKIGMLEGDRGQFFTPYTVSRMMAEMLLPAENPVLEERGFITLSEPACGAGCMVIAAADTLTAQGLDIGACLYVEAVDLSLLAFRMAYIQLSARGVPALVQRANSLTRERFDQAHTPAMIPFLARQGEAFERWLEEGREHAAQREQEARKGEQMTLL
jgi:hypothetical protein